MIIILKILLIIIKKSAYKYIDIADKLNISWKHQIIQKNMFKYRYLELQIDKEPRKVQGSQNSIYKNDILKSNFCNPVPLFAFGIKGTEFLPQIMILQSPYLFHLMMVQTFDILNFHYLI